MQSPLIFLFMDFYIKISTELTKTYPLRLVEFSKSCFTASFVSWQPFDIWHFPDMNCPLFLNIYFRDSKNCTFVFVFFPLDQLPLLWFTIINGKIFYSSSSTQYLLMFPFYNPVFIKPTYAKVIPQIKYVFFLWCSLTRPSELGQS